MIGSHSQSPIGKMLQHSFLQIALIYGRFLPDLEDISST